MSARHNRTPLHRLTTRHTLNALQQQRGIGRVQLRAYQRFRVTYWGCRSVRPM